MSKFKLLLFTLLISLCYINLVTSSLGTYKQGDCVQIKTILNATYVNISTISYPNSTLAISNQVMTKQGLTFNYSFCSTSILGDYVYDYFDDIGNVYVNDFTISATGSDMNTSKSISYILIFIITLLIFAGLLVIGISLPMDNKRDDMAGYIIAISNLKYVKLFSLAFAYLVGLFLVYYSWMICYAYLDMNFLSSIFQTLFYALAICVLPFFILMIYFMVTNWIKDSKVSEMLMRGIDVK